MKPEKIFTTFENQILGLKYKNLKFENEDISLKILKKINYYSLVNGYKEIFLDKNYVPLDKDDPDEKYKDNVFFEDLYSLYYIDSELRNILLKFILNFENNIKTKIIYYFSESYQHDNKAYLDKNNFSQDPILSNTIDNLIRKIGKIINKQKRIVGSRIHYFSVNYNDTVPLWVLMPQLDFGTTSFFFKCCPKTIQSKIAKDLKKEFLENYPGINDNFIFTPESLENILFFVNSFRNICAHNERLYSHQYNENIINTTILHNYHNINFKYGLFDLILILKIFLNPDEYFLFTNLLANPLAFLEDKFDKITFTQILRKMNFNIDWKNILEMNNTLDYKILHQNLLKNKS
jgi:abi family protein